MSDLLLAARDGEPNGAFGLPRFLKVLPEETGDRFSLWREEVPPGAGPPLHIHRTEHELFLVEEGDWLFQRGEQRVTVTAGAMLLVQPGTPHTFKNIGPSVAAATVLLSPGRGVGFFRAVEAEGLEFPRDEGRILALAEAFDLEFVGPPLEG